MSFCGLSGGGGERGLFVIFILIFEGWGWSFFSLGGEGGDFLGGEGGGADDSSMISEKAWC